MMHARRLGRLHARVDHPQIAQLPESVAEGEDCLCAGGKWLHVRICLSDLNDEPSSAESVPRLTNWTRRDYS